MFRAYLLPVAESSEQTMSEVTMVVCKFANSVYPGNFAINISCLNRCFFDDIINHINVDTDTMTSDDVIDDIIDSLTNDPASLYLPSVIKLGVRSSILHILHEFHLTTS